MLCRRPDYMGFVIYIDRYSATATLRGLDGNLTGITIEDEGDLEGRYNIEAMVEEWWGEHGVETVQEASERLGEVLAKLAAHDVRSPWSADVTDADKLGLIEAVRVGLGVA